MEKRRPVNRPATFTVLSIATSLAMVVCAGSRDACEVCECSSPVVNCMKRGLNELPTGIPNDTRLLNLAENFIQDLPYRAFMELKSLSVLNLTDNKIATPFEIPESVIQLQAGNNRFEDIEPMMRNGIKLTSVIFRQNNVKVIESDTFKRCTELVTFQAGNNRFEDIEPMMRNGIKLTSVIFRQNNVKVIESDTFKRCTELVTLDLANNVISEIKERGLAGPKYITHLWLERNNLTELGPNNTAGLHCYTLWLIGNRLRLLRPYTFGSVDRIILENNTLEEVPTGLFLDPKRLHPWRVMGQISFRENLISRISPDAFQGVKSSSELILRNNKLSFLPEDLLANMTIRAILDLSSNELTVIPDGLLRTQSMLRYLYLQRNYITTLSSKDFKGLYSLTELMIFDNPIVEIADGMFYETSLTNVFMFQTSLRAIGTRPFATVNNTIKSLSLYGTQLEHISDTVWQDLAINGYVSVDNVLRFAPAIHRTDLRIELVGDGFAQPIFVSKFVGKLLSRSGFACHPFKRLTWKCTPCPQGFYGVWWLTTCLACPPGGFFQVKTGQVADGDEPMKCQKCNNGTYVTPAAHPGTSPADCVVCPTGTNKSLHAGFRACPCMDNYYRTDRFGECHPCPAEGLNCSGEYQHLLPGFWWTWDWGSSDINYQRYEQFVKNVRTKDAFYDNNTKSFLGVLPKVHPCPHKESCVNSGDGINTTCKHGYDGWLCSQCSTGYYSWLDNCIECPKWWWFLLEVFVVLVVIVVIIIIIVWDLRTNQSSGRSVVNMLFARGKILLGFYQVMGEIFSALDEIPWPDILQHVGSFLDLLEVNIVQIIISPRCYLPEFTYPNIYIEFIFGLSFVVLVVAAAWWFYSIRKCYMIVKKTPAAELTATMSQTKQRCYLFVVMLLFVSYPSLSSVIFTLLPECDLFYLDENETLNVTRLRSNYSIDCATEQHVHFNYSAKAALCYVVGFPSVLFLVLWWSNRRQKKGILHVVNNGEPQPSLLNSEGGGLQGEPMTDVVAPSTYNEDASASPVGESSLTTGTISHDKISWKSFLCENYKPQFWYWEIVELARKILQILFVLLFGPEDPFTMFATIFISGFFLLIHSSWRPMKDAAEHRLQMCSLGTIFLNLLAASLLLVPAKHNPYSAERKEVLAVTLVLLNLSIIVFIAASLMWSCAKAVWRHGYINRMMTSIATVCGHCHERMSGGSTQHELGPEYEQLLYAGRPHTDVIAETPHVRIV